MASNGNGNGNGHTKKRKADEMDIVEFGSYGSFGIGPEVTTQAEVYSDKLDLFSIAPTEKQMKSFRETRYFPTAGLTQDGPYTFSIPGMSSYFLDAGSIYCEGQVSIFKRNDDGTVTPLVAVDKVLPCNMLPVSLFNNVEVSING